MKQRRQIRKPISYLKLATTHQETHKTSTISYGMDEEEDEWSIEAVEHEQEIKKN